MMKVILVKVIDDEGDFDSAADVLMVKKIN